VKKYSNTFKCAKQAKILSTTGRNSPSNSSDGKLKTGGLILFNKKTQQQQPPKGIHFTVHMYLQELRKLEVIPYFQLLKY